MKINKSIITFTIISIVVSNALAASPNICETDLDCVLLRVKTEDQLKSIHARLLELRKSNLPIFDDLSKPAKQMNFYEAERYCDAQGKRLPTVRELALLATSLGAEGIMETAPDLVNLPVEKYWGPVKEESVSMSHLGYEPVHKLNNQGLVVVDFYFNGKNYYGKDTQIWSSTQANGNRAKTYYDGHQLVEVPYRGPENYFLNHDGSISSYYLDTSNVSVRCVSDDQS